MRIWAVCIATGYRGLVRRYSSHKQMRRDPQSADVHTVCIDFRKSCLVVLVFRPDMQVVIPRFPPRRTPNSALGFGTPNNGKFSRSIKYVH